MKWENCIESTQNWLKKKSKSFITIYIEEPGTTAEIFGPDSNESRIALEKVDKFVGNLTSQLNMEETDLIILSTPGFLEVSTTTDKVINLEKVKSQVDAFLTIGTTPVISVKPLKGNN